MLQALIGKSGQDLLLMDGSNKDKPILEKMATDPSFIDPLKQFNKLITYANVKHDPVINYGNANLAYKDLCPIEVESTFKTLPKPHIFEHASHEIEKDVLPGVMHSDPDEQMMEQLASLPWKRYL